MNCRICEREIPDARMLAMPSTRLCLPCKALHDEPKLTTRSVLVSRSMAQGSLSDFDEMQREALQIAAGE